MKGEDQSILNSKSRYAIQFYFRLIMFFLKNKDSIKITIF
jgi:hypothetical protein